MELLPLELDYAAYSIMGKNHKRNEDRYRLLGNKAPHVKKMERGELFAVFDGMGTAPKGAEAAQLMCDTLISVYEEQKEKPSLQKFRDLLFDANMTINNWGCIEGTKRELGACAGTIVWIQEETMSIFHAGDTFGILIQNDTDVDTSYQLLTTEHAIGDGLTNYFGIGEPILIEIRSVTIDDGDIVVLMSDGVIKALDLPTIAARTREWVGHSLEHAVTSLCTLAKSLGSADDITAVMIEVV
ncbi:MAG: protein serine/threonine phosphatase 2C family protein [Desulfamplus sp.]|nr:protein serine/threonine phosphatase 2C family protein [Desulfamplus sp.]